VVAPGNRDGPALVELVRRHGATHVQATPSGWRVLLDGGFDEPGAVALTGGEALPVPLARELRARCARLWNVYGPTETTIWSTIWEVPETVDEVAIGRPIARTRVHVLDEAMGPAGDGMPGELYIGGEGVALGYHGRPALTAQRFVCDPYGPPGSRLYRTGDHVIRGRDGQLRFLGRADDQIKLRGHRIEPGEIECRLLEHPGVAQAAVAARDDRLVGYVVGTVRSEGPPEGLREHLAVTLPDHMIPSAFVRLDRLPLTPNGKLDRNALPDAPARSGGPASRVAGADKAVRVASGEGPVEQVAAIWREVLRVDDVGVHEDLFDLGAHSLTITQIAARIRRRLGVSLPLHVFYDTSTIAGLAKLIASRGPGAQVDTRPARQRGGADQ
jgi:acyl-coenzyme A synthetase/AMP-(fatty) acid ligase/acyl carrier protein